LADDTEYSIQILATDYTNNGRNEHRKSSESWKSQSPNHQGPVSVSTTINGTDKLYGTVSPYRLEILSTIVSLQHTNKIMFMNCKKCEIKAVNVHPCSIRDKHPLQVHTTQWHTISVIQLIFQHIATSIIKSSKGNYDIKAPITYKKLII